MKKPSIVSLALAAACLVTAAAPLHAADEIRTISPELMSALESWSDPAATLESLALDSHPEVLEAYAPEVETFHGGISLRDHFADAYPAAAAAFDAAVADGEGADSAAAGSSAEFLAFVMSHRGVEYAAWQAEVADGGLAFGDFVADRYPGILKELVAAGASPAGHGIGLLDFLGGDADPVLFAEAESVLATTTGPAGTTCSCWTVVAFPQSPAGWSNEINEHLSQTNPWRKLDYTVSGSGVARDIDFMRQTKRTLWEVVRDKSTNLSGLRVRMQCTRNGSPTGEPCSGPTCKGVLDARVAYASRVYDRIDVGGIWSRQARAFTGDMAVLTYDPPGAPPVQTLFSKGVGVAGETQNTWQASSVAGLLWSGVQVAFAATGTPLANVITQDLINSTVTNLAGLITHSGQPGDLSRDMMVAWDTAGLGGIQLLPNQTHLFELEASSKIYSRGYGGESRTWGNLDSASYLVSVARNYQCAPGVQPPPARAHWLYARSGGAPYSSATLQNQVGAFVATELGVTPNNLSNPNGQFP